MKVKKNKPEKPHKTNGFSGFLAHKISLLRMDFLTKICNNKTMKKTYDLSTLSREELEKETVKLHTQLEAAQLLLKHYEELYRLEKQKKHGRSSESQIDGQMSLDDLMLFNEAEAFREPLNIEPSQEELLPETPTRKKPRKKNLKPLPVKEVVYELSAEQQICPKCGSPLHEMKTQMRVEIEVIPASVHVVKHVTKIYACRNCEKNGSATIIKAPGTPSPVIEKSFASSSLLADIFTMKFVYGVPFFRQEKDKQARQIPVTRNNMCNWCITVANDYFKPLTDVMKKILYADHVIHCDETYVQVLHEPDRPATSKSYVWVTASARFRKEHKIALYNYTQTRGSSEARKVLAGYKGYIMCDGYAGYDALKKVGKNGEAPLEVELVACMVHVRRKFIEALSLIRPQDRKNTSAQEAVHKITRIFQIDNKFNDMEPAKRREAREEYLRPALEEFFAWVNAEAEISLPKTKYGQALEYAQKQKEKVMRVLEDGRLELDNNLAERTVKPFVIGRKNWLFCNTPQGAEASCIIYSIVETAKLNNLIPYEYMKYLLDEMPGKRLNEEELKRLLPWSPSLPQYIRNPEE